MNNTVIIKRNQFELYEISHQSHYSIGTSYFIVKRYIYFVYFCAFLPYFVLFFFLPCVETLLPNDFLHYKETERNCVVP